MKKEPSNDDKLRYACQIVSNSKNRLKFLQKIIDEEKRIMEKELNRSLCFYRRMVLFAYWLSAICTGILLSMDEYALAASQLIIASRASKDLANFTHKNVFKLKL